jgi:uncharacterized surface protein with fasciclin (FAS1) repeats
MRNNMSLWKRLTLTALFTVTLSSAAIASPTQDHSNGEMTSQSSLQIAQSQNDIIAIATSNERFSTLVQAVQAADLVETLRGEGPFTVFAPTNEAFGMLPDGIVEFLLQPENKDLLSDVLTYHVVPGNVTSNQLDTGIVESLNGGIAVAVTSRSVVVNNASVIQADISASNGVVHVINRVLLPEGLAEEIGSRMNES